ncbi:hypothetical protein N7539_006037 [Penicillium diatomitis]|uniref:Uncharacterized protein n=1 Tax=Penicillium diatomitis TaxID=2819901 RepID=A0A9W9X4L1_9EURO|nr:uncharacterized protein N7539_006037 [Penicillium diatomitis]KAJ5483837.1 hypothetical protein N7539_006037 [Penicillium diatomitis]
MTDIQGKPKIIVGIDYGTTYSGVAWALQDSSSDVEVIEKWPGGGNATSQKVPSVLVYKDKNLHWGYQVNNAPEAIHGVKLLLDDQKRYFFSPSITAAEALKYMGKDAIGAAGDYVQKLVDHSKSVLHHRFGSALEGIDLQFFMTVPAIWSDKAKDATMQIACRAGIAQKDLYLISEPEAAAVYAIQTIQPNNLTRDDCIIVCDAGGGTVDLITYRITQTDPLRLVEVTEGTGDVCGSMALDHYFETFIRQKIGESKYSRLSDKAKWIAMSRWRDYIKPNFEGPDEIDDFVDVGYGTIPIPGASDDLEAGLQNGVLNIKSHEVEGIFQPVVKRVQELITEQQMEVEKSGNLLKAIILVGGLGASAYLREQVKEIFDEVQVLQPQNAWSAIVRCKSSYYESVHSDREKFWDPLEEKWVVDGWMQWFIGKGDDIAENKPIKLTFYRTVGFGAAIRKSYRFEDELKFCLAEDAPRYCNSRVSTLCRLESDLSRIPKELFEIRENSKGIKYYYIEYELKLTPQLASLLFELEFNGVSYGTVRSKY